MTDLERVPGLERLWAQTTGDENILVAVVDGPVARDHPALAGATIDVLTGVWPAEGTATRPGRHGTAVASVLFGQPGSAVRGVAPRCRGLSVPAFSARRDKTSQLELARGIELAVERGAHVINVSGGQFSPSGESDDPLSRAVRLCAQENVLVVAAAGNDGCACNHVPASLPGVLAVGALDELGKPLAMSNWGPAYRDQGLMAPGENLLTAVPGGGTARRTGTSLATPSWPGWRPCCWPSRYGSGAAPTRRGCEGSCWPPRPPVSPKAATQAAPPATEMKAASAVSPAFSTSKEH